MMKRLITCILIFSISLSMSSIFVFANTTSLKSVNNSISKKVFYPKKIYYQYKTVYCEKDTWTGKHWASGQGDLGFSNYVKGAGSGTYYINYHKNEGTSVNVDVGVAVNMSPYSSISVNVSLPVGSATSSSNYTDISIPLKNYKKYGKHHYKLRVNVKYHITTKFIFRRTLGTTDWHFVSKEVVNKVYADWDPEVIQTK